MKQTKSLTLYNYDRSRRVQIGGGAPISIQSMTNTRTSDAAATINQIRELAQAGCEIIRLAIPDEAAAAALKEILPESPIPVIGDIHFDYRLALAAIENGIAGIRINPGNIGDGGRVRQMAEAAGEAGIVLRVGANAGSINPQRLADLRNDKNFLNAKAQEAKLTGQKFDPLESAVLHLLCQSVLEQCALLQKYDFHNIKVSLKSSSIPLTIKACRAFARLSDLPQHIGITESGTLQRGIIKSCVGIGALLAEGIGDTMRVSLTADPLAEV
ncbi:MAG: flavodoxin-dependent (E)-4-hydroxy-3-methylbut-2-enyl-diphosphate synthase, partial [Victivallaceae bacterium]